MNQSYFRSVVLGLLVVGIMGQFVDIKGSCANPSFAAPQSFNVRLGKVAAADFNGDGLPDVVGAGDFVSNINLMINNGPQGFVSPVTFSTGGWPGAIAVGDFNNDQKPDVVTANFNPANVSILLGNGAGSFAAAINIAVGDSSSPAVSVGDFNADQNQDLAVANSSGTVSILLGTGSGTFSAPTSLPVVDRIRSIAVADFNIDGHKDLAIVGQFVPQVFVLFGNGSGGFSSPLSFDVGSEATSIVAQDFNNDGKPDLAIALFVNMAVLINNGDGTFGTPTILNVAGNNPTSVVTTDFNNDGQYDLAVGHNTGVAVRFGNGDGTFGNQENFSNGLGATYLAADDLDGDGTTDLAVSGNSGRTMSFVMNDGRGGFKSAPRYSDNSDARSVIVKDFNNDSKMDLAVANRNGNSVSIYLGDGAGVFGAARVFTVGAPPTTNITNGPFSLGSADFNGDNKLDLVTANFNGGGLTVLTGDGTGNFVPQKIPVAGVGSPHFLVIGDFNLDTKPDVALTRNGFFSKVTILYGNGSGGFGSSIDFDTGVVNSEALTVGDLNGDNKPDLFVGSNPGSAFSVLLNNGAGGFGAPTFYTLNTNTGWSSTATIGDFTGDGKVDLVVANHMRDTLAVIPGNGAGVFAGPTFVSVGQGPKGLVSADFNVDGLLDVAVAYVDSSAVSVLLNNGAGGLNAPKNYLVGGPHESLAVADFNSDGLPDLANEGISVLLNTCSNVIAPTVPSLSVADVSVGENPVNALFEVSLSSASSQTVTARYQTAGQTAVMGADFQGTSGTLSFAPGEIVKTIAVPLLDDSLNEFTETFLLNLHQPTNAAIKKGHGTGRITDSDPVPSLTLSNVSVKEGDTGTTQANFAVTLSSPSGKLVQVSYSTADLSASAVSDYQAASNLVLNIAAGSSSSSIAILVTGDTTIETDETFALNISSPINATIATASAIGTILDDDGLKLLLDSSGPTVNQAAALDSLLFVRDPFRVISRAEWWNLGADRNTRVLVFADNLTLNPGEPASVVTVVLNDSSGQIREVAAEDVRPLPNTEFTQVMFRLPDGLTNGNCTITLKVHGQISNAGTVRIAQ